MVIKFICPRGHHLSAPDERAGKPGRCPKCGTAFLVPDEHESQAGTPSHPSPASQQDLIIFLCPNGHKLNGPATLAGKPGQCPHCGVKFRIPTGDDATEQTSRSGVPIGRMAGQSRSGAGDSGWSDSQAFEQPLLYEDIPVVDALPAWETPPPMGDQVSLTELFSWFWSQRDEHSLVDVHLRDGAVFTPQYFAPDLSQPGFGVFATREDEDQSYTVTTINWDAVTRISIRQLSEIPEDWFE